MLTNNNSRKHFSESMLSYFNGQISDEIAVTNLCKEKAEAGDYNAMLWLARMYREGKGVRKNKPKSLEWYKKSKDRSIFSKFELLALLSNQKREVKSPPEGLRIDTRSKEKLFVYELDGKCMSLLVKLFPFTHFDVVGFTYKDKAQPGFNESCTDYDKILIGDVENSETLMGDLISDGVESDIIITVKRYTEKDKFDSDAIVCDFSNSVPDKKKWVIVPNEPTGLMYLYCNFKRFRGEPVSKCDYVVDMQNHFSEVMESVNVGLYNPWEYYFQQISPATLDEAYSSKGTIITSWVPRKIDVVGIRPTFSDSIGQIIDQQVEKYGINKKMLGLIARGTEYISLQPTHHGITLDEYELIEIVEERMKSLGFTNVYISTEDQGVYETFMEHFGNRAIAIQQRRFAKEQKYNKDVLDENIKAPFGKLIQGERYLMATYLVTKCGLAITCGGSGSDFVHQTSSNDIIEKHIKGLWGHFGNRPLIVCSHNKNHISFNKATFGNNSLQRIDSKGNILIDDDRELVLNGIDVYLHPEKNYVCSFETKEPEAISALLTICSEEGNTVTLHLKHGKTFVAPFDTTSGTIIVKRNDECNDKIGIQIEEGSIPTEYEPPRFSWTQICIKDTDGREYAPEETDFIDFDKYVFSVNDLEYGFAKEEVDRFHSIICYKGGFLTYHHGEIHTGSGPYPVTSVGAVINQCSIFGKPKQLRRFSHTIEMADSLIKGSRGDVEKALCIYHYHAMNDDANAMIRLARMYRDGEGVEKDVDKSIEWFKKASDGYPKWVAEATDVLLKTTDAHNWEYAFIKCSKVAGNHSAPAGLKAGVMGRLGRMYRDGKGVEKDLDKAIEWMRKASIDGNPQWTIGLFDLLGKRGTPDDLKVMSNILRPLVEAGDAAAVGRMARMYRDGKGTVRDIEKAIDLMRIAADCGIGWAKKEYEQLLKDF